jgi:uncharacterized protein (TIGR00661 family)
MKIAYGVMGYGRGHATRAGAVLPALLAEHEVTVFAGGDAFDVLAPRFDTVRIPTLGYVYGESGTHSRPATVAGNLAPLTDLALRGRGVQQVEREFRERGIELVISDSEAWTLRVARRLCLPTIGFDHIGIIAWCRPHFPADLWLAGMRDRLAYRAALGRPDRILISSFYPAEPEGRHIRVVGPILREEVHGLRSTDGQYLLVYLNKGAHQYGARLDEALRFSDMPVVVYGTPWCGRSENLEFRAPGTADFLRDLAGCSGVISTAGNQLLGEALHFCKPVLALPEDAFEQRLNAALVERLGIGLQGRFGTLSPSDVDRFLGQRDWYRTNLRQLASDGRAEAVSILSRYIRELAPRRASYAACGTGRSRDSSRLPAPAVSPSAPRIALSANSASASRLQAVGQIAGR